MCLEISCKQKLTNDELYDENGRGLKLAGHCIHHPKRRASNLVLWKPSRGTPRQGKRAMMYIDCLCDDHDVEDKREIRTAMNNRAQWKKLSGLVRADA